MAVSQKAFFGKKGGITFSGGEPTFQAKSLIPLFKRLKEKGIHICLDTNGGLWNNDVEELLELTDLVLLDIKEFNPEHHQPVSFGLSVRKSLPKGFSVETGLTYTLLSSDIKRQGDTKMQSQKLHYIGIPVRGNWNFLEKKYFTLYVSAGGMVEKCVYGKLADDKVNVKPLQFSVAGAVGAQFNATDHVGLYVEPGVSYFFDDGSKVQTIRKERPCNFNLQAGLRFTY